MSPYLRTFVVARMDPLRWIQGEPPPLEEVLKTMRDGAARFNVDKVKKSDLADVEARPTGPTCCFLATPLRGLEGRRKGERGGRRAKRRGAGIRASAPGLGGLRSAGAFLRAPGRVTAEDLERRHVGGFSRKRQWDSVGTLTVAPMRLPPTNAV